MDPIAAGTDDPSKRLVVVHDDSTTSDEDDLTKSYDVVIYGTGLVQSILASSLALVGATVLHCDSHDIYGELDASYGLTDFISWVEHQHQHQQNSLTNIPLPPPPPSTTTIHPKGSLTRLHIHSYRKSWTQEEARQSRKFVLDLMPRVLFANGPAVSGLISSSVSSYVEFMTIQGLLLMTDTTLQAVPSSKSQVFQSTLLSPIEKRKLMKFLQLVLEYGELTTTANMSIPQPILVTASTTSSTTNTKDSAATATTDNAGSSIIDTMNERNVHEHGMSLRRPQNKPMNKSSIDQLMALAATSTSSSSSSSHPSLQEYLQSQFQIPTSSFLSQVIFHALCLQHSTQQHLPVTKAMDALVRHVSSLGKYVDTASLTTSSAFIAPLYGTSEIVQGFCRSCAVHGGVYMLRTTMQSILYDGSPSSNDGVTVSGAILHQEGSQERDGKDTATQPPRLHFPVTCKNVVIPQDAIVLTCNDEPRGSTTKILRRTSVMRGTIQLPSQQQRSIVIIPPLTQGISNASAIFILILDSSLNICPFGYTVLHLSTSLVTTCLDHDDEDEITKNSIQSLDKALEYLLNICSVASSNTKTLSTDHDSMSTTEEQVPSSTQNTPQEILQVTFSIPTNDYNLYQTKKSATTEGNQQVRGLHVCKRPNLEITVDEAFEEAERIFHDIMNGNEADAANPKFLKMSNEVRQQVMKNVTGIRNEDTDDDDEKDILASAMDLIGSSYLVVENSNNGSANFDLPTK